MMSELSLLAQFKACHEQLNDMFLSHQELLLLDRLDDALTALGCYWSCHGLHMKFEDRVLLPKYSTLEEAGRWDATLYRQEHQKIDDLFNKTEQKLRWLTGQEMDESQRRRNIIHLLDREKSLKGLCEHHQEREELSLFVELDRQADAHWLSKQISLFSRDWEKKLKMEMQIVRELTG